MNEIDSLLTSKDLLEEIGAEVPAVKRALNGGDYSDEKGIVLVKESLKHAVKRYFNEGFFVKKFRKYSYGF